MWRGYFTAIEAWVHLTGRGHTLYSLTYSIQSKLMSAFKLQLTININTRELSVWIFIDIQVVSKQCFAFSNLSNMFLIISKNIVSKILPRIITMPHLSPLVAQRVAMATTRGPFYRHGLTLMPAWISNHMPGKMWDETFTVGYHLARYSAHFDFYCVWMMCRTSPPIGVF